jgi:CheY-like chemotaxis protein
MSPFYFRLRVDYGDHTRLALPLRRPGRAPGARPLVRAARVLQHASNGARADRGKVSSAQGPCRVLSDHVAVPSASRLGDRWAVATIRARALGTYVGLRPRPAAISSAASPWRLNRMTRSATVLTLRPELILVGHELPELRPYDMIELLKADARTRRIPVLALGARGGLDSRDRPHAEVPQDGSATARVLCPRRTASARHGSGWRSG